jgi:cupin 2 domain-containing protein
MIDLNGDRREDQGRNRDRPLHRGQGQHEWVMVLKGAARLRFEGGIVEMRPGDFINIPAHKKHRVEWTTPNKPTNWLAVFSGNAG